MEYVSRKTQIEETLSSVSTLAYKEKKSSFINEERMNKFLDAIIDFKKTLNEKSNLIYDINGRIEGLTWFNELDETCLILINDLISTAKDLHSSLIRQYVAMNELMRKGIAKAEIMNLKNAIDELKEAYQDLESVFFCLPENPEFVETTKILSLI